MVYYYLIITCLIGLDIVEHKIWSITQLCRILIKTENRQSTTEPENTSANARNIKPHKKNLLSFYFFSYYYEDPSLNRSKLGLTAALWVRIQKSLKITKWAT
jgi:hypothetical protein